ncbi:hypothetical protein NDU88_002111 [Pleurodeles waltl]|uniref:Uncharacterized protein n=1 Tax=Pleurodeles waltl TaxID=8319 RepID=A0AAV7LD96_PLEWA|nr:hypothetical protein NDU88_002111 [Pleurodeles waltl]
MRCAARCIGHQNCKLLQAPSTTPFPYATPQLLQIFDLRPLVRIIGAHPYSDDAARSRKQAASSSGLQPSGFLQSQPLVAATTTVPCDGLALPDPSVKAACAGAAACNPELQDGVTSPFRLLGLKGARRPARAPENAEKEGRRAADEEESVEEAGVWGRKDRRQKRPPVKSQDMSEGEDVCGTLQQPPQEIHQHHHLLATGGGLPPSVHSSRAHDRPRSSLQALG